MSAPTRPDPLGKPTGSSPQRKASDLLLAGLLYLLLAIVATWPLASDLNGQLLFAVRRFDGYGTVWLGEHFWRMMQGEAPVLSDTSVAWPVGVDLRLADSFLFGLFYLPFRVFFSPAGAFNAFSLAAIAGTGLSGYYVASRMLGVGAVGALGAGIVVGFNAVMHSYRIEGEAYLLGGFFLPLFCGYLVRLSREGRRRDGVLAGVMLGGLGWSSGYYAIDGIIAAATLGVVMFSLVSERRSVRELAPAVGLFVVVSLVLLVPLTGIVGSALSDTLGARFKAGQDPLQHVSLDSATVTGLLVPFPSTAHLRQGRIASLGLATLIIGLGALTSRRRGEWLPWLGLVLAGVVLALGPFLRLDDTDFEGPRLPYAWLAGLSSAVLAYRMPARFLAIAFVGLGMLAALFLDRLREERVWAPLRWLLLLCLGVDGLVFSGSAFDRTIASAHVPEGYKSLSGQGAVLDLWGHDRDLLKYAGLSAFYQAHHGHPILTDFTRADDRQSVVARELALAIVSEDDVRAEEVLQVLKDLGVTDIAFHPQTFREADEALLGDGLARLCTRVRPDEEVAIYRIKNAAGTVGDVAAALAKIADWKEGRR